MTFPGACFSSTLTCCRGRRRALFGEERVVVLRSVGAVGEPCCCFAAVVRRPRGAGTSSLCVPK